MTTHKLRRVPTPVMKAKTVTRLVGQVTAGDGITVTKTAGNFVVAADAGAGIFQPLDSDLTAIANNSTNGLWARTASGTGAARTITAPAAGITVSNGDGVSGNPTLALANDLGALEGLGSTGIAVRTATDTWAQRTLTGTTNRTTITNGDGVSGNPTVDISVSYAGQSTIVTVGTLTSGGAGSGFSLPIVTPLQYGATGDGIVDDTTYINLALATGFHVDLAGRIYKITAALTAIATQQTLRNGTIDKYFNGDMIDMSASYCRLENVRLRGSGATYTGRGIKITGGGYQHISNCYLTDHNGYALEFTASDAGNDIRVTNTTFQRTTGTNYAVKFPASDSGTAGRRWFLNCTGEGTKLFDFSGCSYTVVNGGNCIGIDWGTSVSCLVENHRLAFAPTIKGTSQTVTHCPIGGNVTVQGTGHCLDNNELQGFTITIDAAATGYTVYANDAVVVDNNGTGIAISNAVSRLSTLALTGGQIKFPATQSASADANTLDDYEEGTWTPGISFGGGTTGITYTTQVASYTKVGNRCEIDGYIVLSNKGSSTGLTKITGLPFPVANVANNYGNISLFGNALGAGVTGIMSLVDPNTTTCYVYKGPNAGSSSNIMDTDTNNTTSFALGGVFRTA